MGNSNLLNLIFAPLLIAVGVILTLICKNKRRKIADIIIGLGLYL